MELATCVKCKTNYKAYPRIFERYFWRRRCTQCGAKGRRFADDLEETVVAHEAWSGNIKNHSFTGKRKLRGWFFSGHQWSAGLGKFVRKSVSADKNTDTYHETIIDIESGEKIHECEESLRDHQGHGSAKFKRTESEP